MKRKREEHPFNVEIAWEDDAWVGIARACLCNVKKDSALTHTDSSDSSDTLSTAGLSASCCAGSVCTFCLLVSPLNRANKCPTYVAFGV
jgi:hypothetical protein